MLEGCWNFEQQGSTKIALRLTKLNFQSINPKTSQRQSTNLVCDVFNDKLCFAISSNRKLNLSEGTIIFIKLIADWYKLLQQQQQLPHYHHHHYFYYYLNIFCFYFLKCQYICLSYIFVKTWSQPIVDNFLSAEPISWWVLCQNMHVFGWKTIFVNLGSVNKTVTGNWGLCVM